MQKNSQLSADFTNERRWRSLEGFALYRVALSSILVALYFGGIGPSFLGYYDDRLFALSSIIYVGITLSGMLLVYWRTPGIDIQALLAILTDTICLTLLMHASGGITTGLGMLTGISVVMVSLSISERGALFAAAFAALATLGQSVYAALVDHALNTTFTQAGILGTAFFAMALLASTLSSRARASAVLAKQRGLDLANLAQLNAYVLQHIETGIIVTDKNERVRMMNESAWYLCGMPAKWKEATLASVSPVLDKYINTWNKGDHDLPPTFKAGQSTREIQPSFASFGEPEKQGTLIFLDDTTIISQQAQHMKLASLGRLTASIAHEIRNPLGAISHAGQLLSESDALDQSDKRLTEIICNNSERVNLIIENILQLSRRTKGRPQMINLHDYVTTFLDRYCVEHHTDPAKIKPRIEPDDIEVFVDSSHIDQVLTNLLENAFKHGLRDNPEDLLIRVSGGISEDGAGYYLDIADNGNGISDDAAKQIFEPFFSTETSGSGLGLYIAKELCECNRANLSYIPLQHRGSCFRITFSGKKAGA